MDRKELGIFVENIVLVVGSILLLPVYVIFGLIKMNSKNGKIL